MNCHVVGSKPNLGPKTIYRKKTNILVVVTSTSLFTNISMKSQMEQLHHSKFKISTGNQISKVEKI